MTSQPINKKQTPWKKRKHKQYVSPLFRYHKPRTYPFAGSPSRTLQMSNSIEYVIGEMNLMNLTMMLLFFDCMRPQDPENTSMTVKPAIAAVDSSSKIEPQANPRDAALKD
jgi:hypothetical protein